MGLYFLQAEEPWREVVYIEVLKSWLEEGTNQDDPVFLGLMERYGEQVKDFLK